MIGSALAERLRARGDEVLIVTRKQPKTDDQVRWDPNRGIVGRGQLEGLDGVVMLAGAPLADRPWTRARRKILWDSRVQSTEVLLESLARLDEPPGVFVGVGTLGLFGDREDEEIDDEDPPGTGFLAELAVAWEGATLSAEDIGCRAALLRMQLVLSPHGGAFPLMTIPFRYMGGWVGNGRQYTSWISIDDCVGALVHLLDQPSCTGGFNGTVPDAVRNKEWCKALGRAMNRPVMTHAPKWALRGALGELAETIFLASVRASPRKLLATGYEFVDTDIEETFKRLVSELP